MRFWANSLPFEVTSAPSGRRDGRRALGRSGGALTDREDLQDLDDLQDCEEDLQVKIFENLQDLEYLIRKQELQRHPKRRIHIKYLCLNAMT